MLNREGSLQRLKERFDLLVIGGGATGCGIALDAASRGLKTCLVEKNDFGSGTSSRSTKLIHGGVRYLELAVKNFDRSQFHLVREALKERSTLCKIAPHLVRPIALVTPVYQWVDLPYYTLGLQLYDRLAGKAQLSPSSFLTPKESLKRFPMLKSSKLRGSVLYYDGQFDDARMNMALVLSAAQQGAAVLNYVEVTKLLFKNGKVSGAVVQDRLTHTTHEIEAKATLNATGPFLDNVRRLENPDAGETLSVSSGTHIVVSGRFSAPDAGLLIPKTRDGRVLFLLPWEGHTLIGTTDNPASISENPTPAPSDVSYILDQLQDCFSLKIEEKDILAAWTGLRPLLQEGGDKKTSQISRDYRIEEGERGLISMGGGKWTTYRRMAQFAVDYVIEKREMAFARACQTASLPLCGADASFESVAKSLKPFNLAEPSILHLYRTYGSLSNQVANLILKFPGHLAPGHPYLWAEMAYAMETEGACHLSDLLARRIRLLFVDRVAAQRIAPKLGEFCMNSFGWPKQRVEADLKNLLEGLMV